MAQLGDGVGSGFPGVIDTSTTESDDPGGTVVAAAKINDATSAIIAIQTELGANVAGSIVNLVSRLAVEHKNAGTHSAITADSLVLAGKIDTVKAGDLASAATVNIGAANGLIIDITGTTQIDKFDNVTAGILRIIRFDGILIWVHSATETVLPTAANITTAVGDIAICVSEGATNAWRCVGYLRADGTSVALTLGGELFTGSGTYNVPVGVTSVVVEATGTGGGGEGGSSTNFGGSGGAAGGWIEAKVTVTSGGTETVTIGTAGVGGTGVGQDGTAGGNTTFGSLVTANGGSGGSGNGAGGDSGGGSSTTGTLINESVGGSGGAASGLTAGSGGGHGLSSDAGGTGGFSGNGSQGAKLSDGGGGGGGNAGSHDGANGNLGYIKVTPVR